MGKNVCARKRKLNIQVIFIQIKLTGTRTHPPIMEKKAIGKAQKSIQAIVT